MGREIGLSTKCVHSGEIKDTQGSPHTPVYNTTTFAFDSTSQLLDVIEERSAGNLYTRYGSNPSIRSLEAKLSSLENAETSLAFSSGMAAESSMFFAHGREGILCIGNAYGGTLDFLSSQCSKLGILVYLLLGSEVDRLEEVLKENKPGLVFFETPTNPTMEIFDIKRISELSHAHGALVAVDNTFASSVNQQPLHFGADIVMHSATKYLGGHSDITAGVLMGKQEILQPIVIWRKNLGQMLAPEVASLLARSLRTLAIRIARQNQSAGLVAQAMESHSRVAHVLYPGLPNFPQHDLAQSQMSGYGGILTIEVKGTGKEASRIVDRLKIFTIAPSLGGVESLVTQPVTTSHHGISKKELQRRGITDSMIRLSIGLEDPEDLISDLNDALNSEKARGKSKQGE